MKHESIVVVYDSCQAIAEEIADKLGAETVSVQSMNVRQIENSQSLVLAVEFQDGGNLSPHWQYASQMFRGASLNGKNLADYLEEVVFAGNTGVSIAPTPEDVAGFEKYIENYKRCLPIEQCAVDKK